MQRLEGVATSTFCTTGKGSHFLMLTRTAGPRPPYSSPNTPPYAVKAQLQDAARDN